MSGSRLEHWADRILKVKERKLAIFFGSLLALIILLGTAWEKSQPFVRLFTRASADAGEIAKIRKDVEQERDTIGIIAHDANAVRSEMERAVALSDDAKKKSEEATQKAAEITNLVRSANEGVEKIRTTSDFSFLLARAAADDRKAFDQLRQLADEPSYEFHNLALAAMVRIAGDLGTTTMLSGGLDWKRVGADPATTDLEDLKALFNSQPAFNKTGILEAIWHEQRFSKYDRLSFLYEVLKSTESIVVLNAACRAMNEETKLNKNIIGYPMYLLWWDEHGSEYAGVRDYKPPENLDLPADSSLIPATSPSATPSPSSQ